MPTTYQQLRRNKVGHDAITLSAVIAYGLDSSDIVTVK